MKIKVGRIVTAVGILKTVDTTKLKLSTAYQEASTEQVRRSYH